MTACPVVPGRVSFDKANVGGITLEWNQAGTQIVSMQSQDHLASVKDCIQ